MGIPIFLLCSCLSFRPLMPRYAKLPQAPLEISLTLARFGLWLGVLWANVKQPDLDLGLGRQHWPSRLLSSSQLPAWKYVDRLEVLQPLVTIAGRIAALKMAIFCAATQSQPGLHDRGRGTWKPCGAQKHQERSTGIKGFSPLSQFWKESMNIR